MKPAKKKAVGLIILVLILGGGAGLYLMTNRALSPDQVVLSSFELLRAGDFDNLEQCYTPVAWRTFEPLLATATREDSKCIREHMNSLSSIQITEVKYQENTAFVGVNLHSSGGAFDVEYFTLVRQPEGNWQID